MDLIGNAEQILGAGTLDADRQGGPSIDLIEGCDIVEFIANLGNIADRQDHSVGLGDQRQLGDVLAQIPLVLASQKDLLAFAANLTAGQLHVLFADDAGDLT